MSDKDFPAAGEGRFWQLKHQPSSVTKPVKVELREKTIYS